MESISFVFALYLTFGEYFEGNIFDEKNYSFISSLKNNLFIY